MASNLRLRQAVLLGLSGMVLSAGSSVVIAQTAPATEQGKSKETQLLEEVVVTGTMIRGIAPAGSTVIGIDSEEVTAVGATSGQDVLANLPQVTNMFQNLPAVGANTVLFTDRLPLARPNLRSLPNITTTGSSFTLILVDGHRMVPVGISQMAVDAEAVPSALLQRVEVMPDGASAIYGSDAVAGVINFITREKFEGVEASARYGVADSYWAYDANLTAGTQWNSGGVFASFSYSDHDALAGIDRDYIRNVDWNTNSPTYLQGTSLTCPAPNITVNARTYPLTGPGGTIQPFTTNGGTTGANGSGTVSGGNRCDSSNYTTYYPNQKRYDFAGGLSQEITESLKLDLRVFWHRSENDNNAGPFTQTATVLSTNPNYRSVSGVTGANPADFAATQSVRLDYSSVFGNEANLRETDSEWWQVTPTLSWNLTDKWQLRALATYGESESESASRILNATVAQTRITSGLINPYNLVASAAGAFDNLTPSNGRLGEFTFTNGRVVADGPLFSLPGGQVNAALGAEYARTEFTQNQTLPTFVYGTPLKYTQTVKSAFGEVQIPIVGADNAVTALYSLSLSASARYDKYNDFGDTTNPSLGLTYQPIDWVKIRGSWGESFTAPSPTDQLGVQSVGLNVQLNSPTPVPVFPPQTGAAFYANPSTIILSLNQGTVGGLPGETVGPQTSENWSVGFELDPPFLKGLHVGASYYSLQIDDLIAFPAQATGVQSIINLYPHLIYTNGSVPLTNAQVQSYVAVTTPSSQATPVAGGGGSWLSFYAPGVANGTIPVAYVADNRGRNLGTAIAEGIDFNVRYRHDISWGSWDVAVSGNHEITGTSDGGPGTAVIDSLLTSPDWRWSSTLGTTAGGFRGQLTWQHTDGYDLQTPGTLGTATVAGTASFGQLSVDSFNTFDLFFRYDFGADSGFSEDLSATLNINNVLDEDPPLQTVGGLFPGFPLTTGFTLGRFVQLGLNKKF